MIVESIQLYISIIKYKYLTNLCRNFYCNQLSYNIQHNLQHWYTNLTNLFINFISRPLDSIIYFITMKINQQGISSISLIHQDILTIHQTSTQSAKFKHNKKTLELEPPLQLSKKSYSLEADMLTGWKPKKYVKLPSNNVFPINFGNILIDQLARTLSRSQLKLKDKGLPYKLAYLGKRQKNSYYLHQNQKYENPYPIEKKLQSIIPQWPGIPPAFQIDRTGKLSFNSMFEGGNLDLAVQLSPLQYDLFMRVDTNTKGHTNWYYFQVMNKDYVGQVKFNICNFRKEKSLYQRGLRPYGKQSLQKSEWKQVGSKIKYERKKFRYTFLFENGQDYQGNQKVCKYFRLTFTYNFQKPHDKVKFAYCIPYTYTDMKSYLKTLSNCRITEFSKSLSGLEIPMIEVTDQTIEQYNKQIILLTARVHPGESNTSFNVEGFLNFICSQSLLARQLRKKFCFYVIPMLNPDGVVAGNYRASCFGKDLNRTYNQKRKHAFPQTYYLLQFVQQLKKQGKQRFSMYIDFHGHSVKKNAFMYGPDLSISHKNYSLCREFPKIMSSITPAFRYYSCSFKISIQKLSTARAVLNRIINIPFTYTIQSSNSSYYDSHLNSQISFTAQKWRQIGIDLAKALYRFILNRNKKSKPSVNYKKYNSPIKKVQEIENQEFQKNTDDGISQGKSDSQPQSQDLAPEQLQKLQFMIQGKKEYNPIITQIANQKSQNFFKQRKSFNQDHLLKKHNYNICQHSRCKIEKQQELKRNFSNYLAQKALPPIITHNKDIFFALNSPKKQSFIESREKRAKRAKIVPVADFQMNQKQSQNHRTSINKIIMDTKQEILSLEESELILKNHEIKISIPSKKIQLNLGRKY